MGWCSTAWCAPFPRPRALRRSSPSATALLNTSDLSEEDARAAVEQAQVETGLPATDPVRFDPGPLAETILAVATGKGYKGAVTLLESHGIIGRFHSIETPDHNRGKPDPQMIATAMNKAGATRAQTVMIGDTIHDMRMAKAGGVKAIGVSWGYHERAELKAEGADIVIDSFDKLDAAIDQLVGAVDA